MEEILEKIKKEISLEVEFPEGEWPDLDNENIRDQVKEKIKKIYPNHKGVWSYSEQGDLWVLTIY